MNKTTLAELLGDLEIAASPSSLKNGAPVTIWLPPDVKARYDRVQARCGRRFTQKARAVLIELIELADGRLNAKGKL